MSSYNSDDDMIDIDIDIDVEKELQKIDKPKKKPREREFYVKGAELIAEIKKYQDSKKTDPER